MSALPPAPTPADALRAIIARATVIQERGKPVLVVEAPPDLLDFLAAFEADREDFEENGDDEDGYDVLPQGWNENMIRTIADPNMRGTHD